MDDEYHMPRDFDIYSPTFSTEYFYRINYAFALLFEM